MSLAKHAKRYCALAAGHYTALQDNFKKKRKREDFEEAFEQEKVCGDSTLTSIRTWNSLLVIQHVCSCLCKG